jgi:hypothetical protein
VLALLLSFAWAGSYTLDDIVAASQRGMSPGAIDAMVQSNPSWTVSHDDAMKLLRSGVSPDVVRSLTGGKEPTAETLAAAKQPGPVWTKQGAAAAPKQTAVEMPYAAPALDPDTLEYELVAEAPGSADELYRRARAWFSKAFNDADRVLDLEDPVDHHLRAKALAQFSQSFIGGADTTAGVIHYVVTVDTKEGRYRARIGDYEHDARSPSNGVDFGLLNGRTDPGQDQCTPRMYCVSAQWRTRVWGELKDLSTRTGRSLIESLRSAMDQPGTESTDDDW